MSEGSGKAPSCDFKTYVAQGAVVTDFGEPLSWFSMSPEQAEGYAKSLREAAAQARRDPHRGPSRR